MNFNELIQNTKTQFLDFKNKFLTKIKNQKNQEIQENTNNIRYFKNKKFTNIVLVSIVIGFILGAFTSSVILYFKIKNLNEQYQNMQQKVNALSSNLGNVKKTNMPNQNTQSNNMPNPAQVINNLPNSDAFASFYIAKLNEAKNQQNHKPTPASLSPPPIKQNPLPPLSKLIKEQNQPKLPPIPSMPELPNISMIICSNECYAISSNGQIYENGFIQGNYKLVVNQNQVYWVKR